MNARDQKQIQESRAAVLLGMSEEELRRLSQMAGLGQVEKTGQFEQMVYSYEELRQICLLAIPARH
ncbi:MAG TPA: hypothetical protein VJK29_16255 [Terriglobales bacterium]|nr:hypothetical protein [Terriglobales bacterium]